MAVLPCRHVWNAFCVFVSRLQRKLEDMALILWEGRNMLPSVHQDIANGWVSGMGIGSACIGIYADGCLHQLCKLRIALKLA